MNKNLQVFLGKNAVNFCRRFNLRLPIIQAGMVWASGPKLSAACANAGIIGTIGAGSMKPDLLASNLAKAINLCKDKESSARLAVNLPLLYEQVETQIDVSLNAGIKIFITSAGSPKLWTEKLKQNGAHVFHVVSHPSLAKKCRDAQVDIIIAEGFEAGGHNGREELTTMCLMRQVAHILPPNIPLVAAGGIMDAQGLMASIMLGASAVQMGTKFLLSQESSAHERFKKLAIETPAGGTKLVLKKHIPVRLLRNTFCKQVEEMESHGASKEELEAYLGKGRAKLGIFEGDLEQGELEIGQGHCLVKSVEDCEQIVTSLEKELLKLAQEHS